MAVQGKTETSSKNFKTGEVTKGTRDQRIRGAKKIGTPPTKMEHYDWRDSFDEAKDTRTSFVDKSGFYKKGANIVQTPSDEKGNLPSNPRLGFSKETLAKKGKLRMRDVKFGIGESHYDWRETLDEKCWAGYEKKGMKTMFGKRYPNCVKKSKKKK